MVLERLGLQRKKRKVEAGKRFTGVSVYSPLDLGSTPEMETLVNFIVTAAGNRSKLQLGDKGWWHSTDEALSPAHVVSLVSREIEQPNANGRSLAAIMLQASGRLVERSVEILSALQGTVPRSPEITRGAAANLLRIISGPDDVVNLTPLLPIKKQKIIQPSRLTGAELDVLKRGGNRRSGRKSPIRMYAEDFLGLKTAFIGEYGLPRDFYTLNTSSQQLILAHILKRRFELNLWQCTDIEETVAHEVARMFAPHRDALEEMALYAPGHYGLITAFSKNPFLRQGEIQNISPIGIQMGIAMRAAGQAIAIELIRKQMDIQVPPDGVTNDDSVLGRFKDPNNQKPHRNTVYQLNGAETAGKNVLILLRLFLTYGSLNSSDIDISEESVFHGAVNELRSYILGIYMAVVQQIANFAAETADKPIDIHRYNITNPLSPGSYKLQAEQFIQSLEEAISKKNSQIVLPYPIRGKN